MKKNQLIACIAAGVIAVGGAGTVGGIALHNHSKNQAALAALESQMSELADAVTATETELVTETEKETQTAPKPTETQAKPTQPTQAPQTTATPPAPAEPEKITWEYDAELSQQVSELIVQRAKSELGLVLQYDPKFSSKDKHHLENYVHDNTVIDRFDHNWMIKPFSGENIAQQIVEKWWTEIKGSLYLRATANYVDIFKYSNGVYFVSYANPF